MTLAQMRALMPLVEEVAKDLPPAFSNPYIEEGEPVLNNLAPFSIRTHGQRFVWVLDWHGNVVHEYREAVR